jgi:predicted  nucleic acid-binding Zn-ribbon protein
LKEYEALRAKADKEIESLARKEKMTQSAIDQIQEDQADIKDKINKLLNAVKTAKETISTLE